MHYFYWECPSGRVRLNCLGVSLAAAVALLIGALATNGLAAHVPQKSEATSYGVSRAGRNACVAASCPAASRRRGVRARPTLSATSDPQSF
jgi:uncharacterized membrane protein